MDSPNESPESAKLRLEFGVVGLTSSKFLDAITNPTHMQ